MNRGPDRPSAWNGPRDSVVLPVESRLANEAPPRSSIGRPERLPRGGRRAERGGGVGGEGLEPLRRLPPRLLVQGE